MATLAPFDQGTSMRPQRDQLILRYAPLVRHAVGQFATQRPGSLEAEDIYSYGTMGLIDAIDRFDVTRGVKFETYAVTRIRGYLLDELRAQDWLPRSARAQVRVVQRATARMEEQLGRKPERQEVAEASGLPAATFDRALADSGRQMVSLESLFVDDGEGSALSLLQRLEDENSPNPALAVERDELRLGVATALQALPQRERDVLLLRYDRNWTLKQIAAHLAISESRVSQLHSQALARMRRTLSGTFGDLSAEQLSA